MLALLKTHYIAEGDFELLSLLISPPSHRYGSPCSIYVMLEIDLIIVWDSNLETLLHSCISTEIPLRVSTQKLLHNSVLHLDDVSPPSVKSASCN